jgi:dipeptidyl aminopeptidase/acylaminoacyl peptidase
MEEVDPARVGVLGASFGGYAVLCTITTHPSAIAAAVNVNGPSDLSAHYREAPVNRPVALAVLGGPPEQQVERYREESPITYADRISIPLLAIHGTADKTVPYRQSQVLVAALERAGKRHKLITYEGIDHGFPILVWANAMQHAMTFFQQELKAPSQ